MTSTVTTPAWSRPGTDVGVHIAEVAAATSPLTGATLHHFVDAASGPQAADRN